MTNENGIGGTALVNPATTGLKHSLRSATRAKEEQLEEATLIREEGKFMDENDEEITSEEDSLTADAADKMERTMLTVALVTSAVDARKLSEDSGDSTDPSKHRYGLRKRRRQSGEDLKRLEHFQSSTDGGLARATKRPALSGEPDRDGDVPKRPARSGEPDHDGDAGGESTHDGDAGDKSTPLPPPPVLDDPKAKIKSDDSSVKAEPDDPSAKAESDDPSLKAEPEEPSLRAEPDEPILKAEPDEPILKAEPEEPSLRAEPEEATMKAEPEEATMKAEPEEPTLKAEPEEPTPKAEPDEPTPKAEPEERTLIPKAEPEQLIATAELVPEQLMATSELVPEKVVATAESEPEQLIASVELVPEQLIAAAELVPEQLEATAELVPEQLIETTELVPEQLTAITNLEPEQLTATTNLEPEQLTVTTNLEPEQLTATAKSDQATAARKESAASRDSLQRASSTSSVPNPLSRPIHPPSTLLPDAKAPKTEVSSSIPPVAISAPVVPCPLPAAAFEEKVDPPEEKVMYVAPELCDKRKVSINESVRSRGFSIDMDAKDIFAAAPESGDKRKVTINEDHRNRGFSIDMDSILDMPDDSSAAHGQSDIGGSRDRAFSFECFAFGINADEPLPPLEQSASSSHGAETESFSGRPRGDSIIFDPVSFQDGGIHELTALDRARSQSLDFPEPTPFTAAAQHPGAPVMQAQAPALVPSLAKVVPYPVASANPAVRTTLPTITNITPTISTSTGTSTGSFSLDLLNKDGRIGIYLPDARRARIARFHAKRAKRIWRKRIKYDCRKKLADSRPRIKGRFVKRSDMDDEVQ